MGSMNKPEYWRAITAALQSVSFVKEYRENDAILDKLLQQDTIDAIWSADPKGPVQGHVSFTIVAADDPQRVGKLYRTRYNIFIKDRPLEAAKVAHWLLLADYIDANPGGWPLVFCELGGALRRYVFWIDVSKASVICEERWRRVQGTSYILRD